MVCRTSARATGERPPETRIVLTAYPTRTQAEEPPGEPASQALAYRKPTRGAIGADNILLPAAMNNAQERIQGHGLIQTGPDARTGNYGCRRPSDPWSLGALFK